MVGIMEQWGNIIFIELEEGRGSIGRFQGSPMLSLPGIIVVHFYIAVPLLSFIVPKVFYGYIEHMDTKIRAYITPVAKSLFLVIVHYFPANIILNNSGKVDDIWKITGMEQQFHGLIC
jgi:hypothetical protein